MTEIPELVLGLFAAPGGRPFAGLPTARNVLLILVDGLGWPIFEQLRDRLPRLTGFSAPIRTQFPSTTAANVTTLHTGLTVGETGLYEWIVHEPSLDALVAPLMYSYAKDTTRDTLLPAAPDPLRLLPFGTVYQRLADAGVPSTVHQSAKFTPSTFSSVVLRPAALAGYDTITGAIANVVADLARPGPRYSVLYVNEMDAVAHISGPESAQYREKATQVLRELDAMLAALPAGTVVLLTADHGHVAMDPDTTVHLNELWPALPDLLRRWSVEPQTGPAGSPRDCFLHVREADTANDIAKELRSRLDGVATVHLTDELIDEGVFGDRVTGRLRERVGEIVVLPAPGETVWWKDPLYPNVFRGHHGGLSDAEMLIPLCAQVL
ncbi:alkaline phosphatase family protein [Dactylosporangium cerinum]|uniref:Alkaline phosphatase family protein n=1 Tax=Dactylosporangium cerinum TaxID=1434730 RepID=A0ABV9VV63_9ACTN